MRWGWIDPRNWFAATAVRRGYVGARQDRRTAGWVAGGDSANAEVGRDAPMLRQRARDLARNSPYGKSVVDKLAAYLLGRDGITPRAATGIEELDRILDDAWRVWARQCHANGRLHFTGLQRQAVRGMVMSGETYTRSRPRASDSGRRPLAAPVRLEVLEADLCDLSLTSALPGQPQIVQGVELGDDGAPVAYHFFRNHPGETGIGMLRLGTPYGTIRVPADTVAHLFDAIDRPGAVHGVSYLHAIIQLLKDFEGFQDAIRVGNRARACLMAWITGGQHSFPDDPSVPDGFEPALDNDGKVLEGFRPGGVAHLSAGKEVKFNDPTPAGNYEQHVTTELHGAGAGVNLPYAVLTGDIRKANFANIRFGMESFETWLAAVRRDLIIPLWCQPVWGWFIDALIVAGEISETYRGADGRPIDLYGAASWQLPARTSVDRYKDVLADVMEIRGGIASRTDAIRRRGRDPDEVLAEIVRERERDEFLGLVFDSDAAATTSAGVAQADVADAIVEADSDAA